MAIIFENSLNPMQYVKSTLNSISIPIISESEVVATVKSLKNSSAGYDEVPSRILKQNINIFIKPLTHLINSSIKEGIFPDELKIAKVVPIFKAADKHCIENYRPISVLSVHVFSASLSINPASRAGACTDCEYTECTIAIIIIVILVRSLFLVY